MSLSLSFFMFQVVSVLSKHAGLWITREKEIMYSQVSYHVMSCHVMSCHVMSHALQATHINFICPMRFDNFPLDTQTCKFQVGSYSYDMSKMAFDQTSKVQG